MQGLASKIREDYAVRRIGAFNSVGVWTLYVKEVKRFFKVGMQTDDKQGFQYGDKKDEQVGKMWMLRNPDEQVLQQIIHGNRGPWAKRSLPGSYRIALNTCAEASSEASITLSVWVEETNPAS